MARVSLSLTEAPDVNDVTQVTGKTSHAVGELELWACGKNQPGEIELASGVEVEFHCVTRPVVTAKCSRSRNSARHPECAESRTSEGRPSLTPG